MKQLCCFLSDNKERCDHVAEFTIYGGSGHPEDYTESCEAHVGALIGTPTWMEKENESWTVVAIQRQAVAGTTEER